jgi:hypothetical protein
MLYRSTDRLCRCGAPVQQYLSHNASRHSLEKYASLNAGTKHLVPLPYLDVGEDLRQVVVRADKGKERREVATSGMAGVALDARIEVKFGNHWRVMNFDASYRSGYLIHCRVVGVGKVVHRSWVFK